MNGSYFIKNVIKGFSENELFFASTIYNELFRENVNEMLFYKTLERMTKNGELIKISKGVYHLPKLSKYGIVPLSTDEIVRKFTDNYCGTIIGYSLYNSLNLTTQIPKTVNVLSSLLEGNTKNIKNVSIRQVSIYFSREVEKMIQTLEVLQDFYNIEDINYNAFMSFVKEVVKEYNDKVFDEVITMIHYKKSTIAFLQEILNYFKKENKLHLYLSGLSEYKHPKMEEIYESSRI